jgi:GNAT superfamily N-acetyltransferase
MKKLRHIIREAIESAMESKDVRLDFDKGDIMLNDETIGYFELYKTKSGFLKLAKIEILPKYQRMRYATQVMNKIIAHANQEGATIILTPDPYLRNLTKNNLIDWYKKLGFIMNKGKNKDFTHQELMQKFPDSLDESNWPQSNMRNFIPPQYPTFPNPSDYDQFGNRLDDINR